MGRKLLKYRFENELEAYSCCKVLHGNGMAWCSLCGWSDEEWDLTIKSISDWFTITRFLMSAGVQGVPCPLFGEPIFDLDIVAEMLSLKDAREEGAKSGP